MSAKGQQLAQRAEVRQDELEISDEQTAEEPFELPTEQELLVSQPPAPGERVWQSHEELFAAENRHLVGFARNAAGVYDLHSDLAEDVVQDAWEALLLNWDSVKRPLPWLYTVVRRKIHREHERKLRRYCGTELGKAAERATWVSPATAASAHEVYALNEALRAVEELPERQRAVVLLSAIADRSYDEIAEILGLSSGTVGAHAHRARGKLRERLGNVGTFVLIIAAIAGVISRPANTNLGEGAKPGEAVAAVFDDTFDDDQTAPDPDDEPLETLRRAAEYYQRLRSNDDLTPDPDSWYEHQADGYLDSDVGQMSREELVTFATTVQEIVDGFRGEQELSV